MREKGWLRPLIKTHSVNYIYRAQLKKKMDIVNTQDLHNQLNHVSGVYFA